MDGRIRNYKSFFADQIKESVDEQQKMNHSTMGQLFKTDALSLGYIERVQSELGTVIIKFPRSMAPRLKVQRSITVIKKNAKLALGEKVTEWTCKWGDFCDNPDYHSAGSSITPLYYVSGRDDGYDYVACAGLSMSLYDLFLKTTKEGKSLPVIIYSPFPPIEYYKNMMHYMDIHPEDTNLFLEPKMSYKDWQPEELAFDKDNPDGIADTISGTLESEGACILQGPPGTGKSYTIATIVASYLKADKSVCVTTMANKGIVELIKQKPLAEFVAAGLVSKTNLSIDERKQIKGVKNASNSLTVTGGELMCATNYVLSSVFSERKIAVNGIPSYDLIVIEEASQAYLTTISAFRSLGKRCLIVGDPMQLPPIAKTDNPMYNSWNVYTQLNGLTTFALGSNLRSYRIITTFRLTAKAAALTSIFYGERFASVKNDYLDYSLTKGNLFPNEGGVLFYPTGDVRNGVYSEAADKIIRKVVSALEEFYPNRSLAIITPFRASVIELQKRFSTSDMTIDITIETIDRIQGMTVDYAILYLPGRNPAFALEDKHFNVGTSRSLSTTLIVSDLSLDELRNFHSASPMVLKFLSRCDRIDAQEKIIAAPKVKVPEILLPKSEEAKVEHVPVPVVVTSKEDEKPAIGLKIVGKIDLSQFERPKKEIVVGKKNYYIIDTNVFVNCPDIINRISSEYPVILSAKVADELDKMKIKLDEQGKQNAEKALRSLNNISGRKVIYEFADTSLLPDDFDKRSPDNMILSVALKYKDENPIMLTSDNGLQLKSKILKISTISLKNFLKR